MKIVSLEIKKVEIGKFFPKKNEVELHIFFNDGHDKEIFKVVNVGDGEHASEEILADLRKIIKNIHKKDIGEEESIIGNFLNIVVKGEDKFAEETAKFIEKVKIKMEEIMNKKDADGYINMIREFKSMKLELGA
tara:strand:- start:310 stop:711 length:402 start_codon:yes stop_codon:yes gene_type:complete